MYIKEININGFRNLRDVHLGPFKQNANQSDLIVLAGPNGGGKSSILEMIAIELTRNWNQNLIYKRSIPVDYSCEIGVDISSAEASIVKEYIASDKSQINNSTEVIKYIDDYRAFYINHNYTPGRWQEKHGMYGICRALMLLLRDRSEKHLGFFIRSDRSYAQPKFEPTHLLQYENEASFSHLLNLSYNETEGQFSHMYNYLVQQKYHYLRRLGSYHDRRIKGNDVDENPPPDPIEEYNRLFQEIFPGYRIINKEEPIPTELYIELPNKKVIPFNDLSSGEKEVFFILSFFLRHNIHDSIILIDEPELHLHPELARRFIRTMLRIKEGNQIWIATHNTEIIDEAGTDRTIFISLDPVDRSAVIISGEKQEKRNLALREFFGHSGYTGIAKDMVFLEGDSSSVDRKVFSNIFANYSNSIKIIPVGSTGTLNRLNSTILSLFSGQLGWLRYYLIRDKDFLTPDELKKYRSSEYMHVLDRCEIENYLLDQNILAEVLRDIFDKNVSPESVEIELRQIAIKISGEQLANMMGHRLRILFKLGDPMKNISMYGKQVIDSDGNRIKKEVQDFQNRIKANIVSFKNMNDLNDNAIETILNNCINEIKASISNNSNDWKKLYPGKELLSRYAESQHIQPRIFVNSLIKAFSHKPEAIPLELKTILETIREGKPFGIV